MDYRFSINLSRLASGPAELHDGKLYLPIRAELVNEFNNELYVNTYVNEKREADAYGHTHYCRVDQRVEPGQPLPQAVYLGNLKPVQPKAQPAATPAPPAQPAAPADDPLDDGGPRYYMNNPDGW